jgi:aminopeptidase N
MLRRLATATLTTGLAVLAVGAPPASARGGDDPRPGAPGIGDPYFPLDGNGGYDVKHYDLDLRYTPGSDRIDAVATIKARATHALSRFNLDLQGLTVEEVSVDDREATWTRSGDELVIRPAEALEDDERFTVRIAYGGVPRTIEDAFGASGFMHTDDGAIVAGQPHVAATWFPANDHPRDAASVSVSATVPEGLEAVSNGVLRNEDTRGGWTTWSWRAKEPMAPYLVTLAIGEFDVRRYTEDGIRYWDALDPDLFDLDLDPTSEGPSAGDVAKAALDRQPEIVDFLERGLGHYPFRSGGGIVDDHPEFLFALETQTRSIYPPVFFTDRISGEAVVVHELAHQWAGNLVRLDEWRHIWLNEGFATYAEWLWLEHEGTSTAQQEFDAIAGNAPPEFWQTTIGDPGPAAEDLFDVAVYLRGAMTLHALRQEVGDDAFFTIVRKWISSQAGSTATTDEFFGVAEKVSDRQLDDFVETWLFTPEKPAGL